MQLQLSEMLAKLEQYVNLPSGSWDKDDVNAFNAQVQKDFEGLGMTVERHDGGDIGDTLVCRYGKGPNRIMLMGHMDTVFPHYEAWKFRLEGNRAYGPGTMDMKGGILVMYYALREVLPKLPEDAQIVCVLNPDEEIGSGTSRQYMLENAREAIAAISFEPMRPGGIVVSQRKGVISFGITCTGQRGHAGAAYLTNASAIQQLCSVVNKLYTMRDDERQVSVNVGTIQGGVAENIIAGEAGVRAEIRYYEPAMYEELVTRLKAICDEPGLKGTTTTLELGPSHPPFKANERCRKLLGVVQAQAARQGRAIEAVASGGASDVAFAAIAGAPAIDCMGLIGEGAHTKEEFADVTSFIPNVELAVNVITELLAHPECVK